MHKISKPFFSGKSKKNVTILSSVEYSHRVVKFKFAFCLVLEI